MSFVPVGLSRPACLGFGLAGGVSLIFSPAQLIRQPAQLIRQFPPTCVTAADILAPATEPTATVVDTETPVLATPAPNSSAEGKIFSLV